MKKKIFLLGGVTLLTGCAQFIPPTGGAQDKEPPKLITSIPKQKQTNFKGREIVLEFNELIQTNNLKQELLITPAVKSKYEVKDRGQKVVLSFDKDFVENTTYTLNFRQGIKDLNESNVAKNLKVVFSTGAMLDSLSANGHIKNLFTKKPVPEATVGLYSIRPDTVPMLKRKPAYFTKTDSAGKYGFENIKQGNYLVIAFQDKNSNLQIDEGKDWVGVAKDTLQLNKHVEMPEIYLHPYDRTLPKIKRTIPQSLQYIYKLDKPIAEAKLLNWSDTVRLTHSVEEVLIHRLPTTREDSLKIAFQVTDSLGNAATFTQKLKFTPLDVKRAAQILRVRGLQNEEDWLINNKLQLAFEKPIDKFDEKRLSLRADSANVAIKSINWNNLRTILTIEGDWGPSKNKVELKSEAGTFKTVWGDSTSAFTLNYTLAIPEKTGDMRGRVEPKATQGVSYVVELLQAETQRVIQQKITTSEFYFPMIKPGSYQLRAIEDKNQNGKWDSGKVFEGERPERIGNLETIIRVKENFSIEDLILKFER